MYSRSYMYARVSSTKQDTFSQKPQLEKWKDTNDPLAKLEEDVGTGKNMTRKGIQRIMAGIMAGETKRVVVCCLNRLGRNAAQVWDFIKLCEKHQVQLISLREGIDLSTSMGRAMAQIAAVFAELDNEMRSEATRAGLQAAKEHAAKLGRPWKANGNRKGYSLKVTDEKATAIMTLKQNGTSNAKIARAVGLSANTVATVIKNPREQYISRAEQARRLKGK